MPVDLSRVPGQRTNNTLPAASS